MSFKRDGDDKCALDNQRKRRVAELLYEDIDDEEVMRLSNGKFKCKLCVHQPIFDTLNMFYVHKQGKKHQHSIEYASQQKQELADLIEKRNHEQLTTCTFELKKQTEGSVNNCISNTTLGLSAPRRRYDRRTILDCGSSTLTSSNLSTEATSSYQLPGNISRNMSNSFGRNSFGRNSFGRNYGTGEKHVKYARLENHGSDTKQKKTFQTANKTRSSHTVGNDDPVISTKNLHKLVGQSDVDQRNKYYLSRKKQRMEAHSSNEGIDKSLHESEKPAAVPSQTWKFYKEFSSKVPSQIKSLNKSVSKVSTTSSVEISKDQVRKEDNLKKVPATDDVKMSRDKLERAEMFLHALGSGWKKDWTGQWVKDEDVEFDSDEEPPTLS